MHPVEVFGSNDVMSIVEGDDAALNPADTDWEEVRRRASPAPATAAASTAPRETWKPKSMFKLEIHSSSPENSLWMRQW